MNILVSSCLLGENVRYDGAHNRVDNLQTTLISHKLIPFCPEVEGGLTIPRTPAEIINTLVITKEGKDVTQYFQLGAQKALSLCKERDISIALLKAKSPSCGNEFIYDGTFTGKLVQGQGVTANILKQNGIKVFNENQLDELTKYLKTVG